jgi:hypothetical protein
VIKEIEIHGQCFDLYLDGGRTGQALQNRSLLMGKAKEIVLGVTEEV